MITSPDLERIRVRFKEQIPKKKKLIIQEVMQHYTDLIVNRAKTHYLTGGALKVKSGMTRASVRKDPSSGVKEVSGGYEIGIKVGTVAGKFWEKGGYIPAHTIYPRNTKALRFYVDGEKVFAMRARIPGRTEKARPWLKPSINDYKSQLRKAMAQAGVKLFIGKRGEK